MPPLVPGHGVVWKKTVGQLERRTQQSSQTAAEPELRWARKRRAQALFLGVLSSFCRNLIFELKKCDSAFISDNKEINHGKNH